MVHCYNLAYRAAACDASTLIIGETGTGKELLARAIHDTSVRQPYTFCVVDCTSIPQTLAESLLFGHRKGAFTSASENQIGLIKLADRGTLFLDEIGELPSATQKSLLRVIQEKRFRPIGSHREETCDFRVVAATNRDLYHQVDEGSFRDDLFFRLQTITIEIPPLRKRVGDIPHLANYFLKNSFKQGQLGEKQFTSESLHILSTYDWPGNVRELINVVERSVIEAFETRFIEPIHLPKAVFGDSRKQSKEGPKSIAVPSWKEFLKRQTVEAARRYVTILASSYEGVPIACNVAQLSESQLYKIITLAGYRGWRSLLHEVQKGS
jgi:two-component system NtrC family response regulator